MKELEGKTVVGLRVSEGEAILVFDHPDGAFTAYVAVGDCCSETWFADIVGVEALLGHTVISVEMVDIACVDDGRSRQAVDEVYGVKLRTEKGIVDIVYRNSSNGYYGGWVERLAPNGLLPENLRQITKDWSA